MNSPLLRKLCRCAAVFALLVVPGRLGAQLAPIVPRDVLFGNPERSQPGLSPDGRRLDDPKDADLIRNASPLFRADKIVRPLLIGQGAKIPGSTSRSPSRLSRRSRRTREA
jgi:hypothetical protein